MGRVSQPRSTLRQASHCDHLLLLAPAQLETLRRAHDRTLRPGVTLRSGPCIAIRCSREASELRLRDECELPRELARSR